ncbi:hypothetical protein PVAP13_J683217 [Panicum virgatum]|nr:hypothetical protein PVAP13_J683217 [Panicum virgatum]
MEWIVGVALSPVQDIHRGGVPDRLSAFAFFSQKSRESLVSVILERQIKQGLIKWIYLLFLLSAWFILKVKMVSHEVLKVLERRKFNHACRKKHIARHIRYYACVCHAIEIRKIVDDPSERIP